MNSRVCRIAICVALAWWGGPAAAQYTPTPPPSEYIDPATGGNVGCERQFGTADPVCGGSDAGNSRPRPPPKPDVWGAIAVSAGLDWGTSWNYQSEQAAKTEALRRCQLHAKPGACRIAVSVADVCTALVMSDADKLWRIGGPTGAVNFAEANGKLLCQRAGGKACKVAVSFCADGVRHELKGETVYSNGNPIFVPEGQSATPYGRTRR
jgi:hypothetical protein